MSSDDSKKLEEIESVTKDFIVALGKSVIKSVDDIPAKDKTTYLIGILKILHNKDA